MNLHQEKFQKKYEEKISQQRLKEFAQESKKFDTACLNIAKALLARVGSNVKDAQNQNIKDFTIIREKRIIPFNFKWSFVSRNLFGWCFLLSLSRYPNRDNCSHSYNATNTNKRISWTNFK